MPLAMRVEFLHSITDQVDRMVRTIDSALDVGRLEAGISLDLNMQEVDIADRLRHVSRASDPGFARDRIHLHIGPGCHTLHGDQDKLDGRGYRRQE